MSDQNPTALDVMPELRSQIDTGPDIPEGYKRRIDPDAWSNLDPSLRQMIADREEASRSNRVEQLDRVKGELQSEIQALRNQLASQSAAAPSQETHKRSDDPWANLGAGELKTLLARGLDAMRSGDEDGVQVGGAQLARAVDELVERKLQDRLAEATQEWGGKLQATTEQDRWERNLARTFGEDAIDQNSELFKLANQIYRETTPDGEASRSAAQLAFRAAKLELDAKQRDRTAVPATVQRDLEVGNLADATLRTRNAITSAAKRGDMRTAAKADLTNFFMGNDPVFGPRASL